MVSADVLEETLALFKVRRDLPARQLEVNCAPISLAMLLASRQRTLVHFALYLQTPMGYSPC